MPASPRKSPRRPQAPPPAPGEARMIGGAQTSRTERRERGDKTRAPGAAFFWRPPGPRLSVRNGNSWNSWSSAGGRKLKEVEGTAAADERRGEGEGGHFNQTPPATDGGKEKQLTLNGDSPVPRGRRALISRALDRCRAARCASNGGPAVAVKIAAVRAVGSSRSSPSAIWTRAACGRWRATSTFQPTSPGSPPSKSAR